MPNSSDSWHSFEILLDWEPEECPTIERPIPLELIRLTDRERWADSCPTIKTQVPPELVAKSVPPPADRSGNDDDAYCASIPRSGRAIALPLVSSRPAVLCVAFLASAIATSTLAVIIRYGLGLF